MWERSSQQLTLPSLGPHHFSSRPQLKISEFFDNRYEIYPDLDVINAWWSINAANSRASISRVESPKLTVWKHSRSVMTSQLLLDPKSIWAMVWRPRRGARADFERSLGWFWRQTEAFRLLFGWDLRPRFPRDICRTSAGNRASYRVFLLRLSPLLPFMANSFFQPGSTLLLRYPIFIFAPAPETVMHCRTGDAGT